MVYKFATEVTSHELRISALIIATSRNNPVGVVEGHPVEHTADGVRKVIREIEPAAEAFTEFRQAIFVLSNFIGDTHSGVTMSHESIDFVIFTLMDLARHADGVPSTMFG